MPININSKSDCADLIERIQNTLLAKGYPLSRIQQTPDPFPLNDRDFFEGLCKAILTRQANWSSVVSILPKLKMNLHNYNINAVANMTDAQIKDLYNTYKVNVKKRFLKDELIAIRDNAKIFQNIISKHGSVCTFIKIHLPPTDYNLSLKCYVQPVDDTLIQCFTNPKNLFKLRCVGLAICCEFFNNVGIDEFKPDGHIIRFLNRIGLLTGNKQQKARQVGITMAATLGKPRKYVDSHIWCFCAAGEGNICTEKSPKCNICKLRTQLPRLCYI